MDIKERQGHGREGAFCGKTVYFSSKAAGTVYFADGSRLLLDMNPYLDKIRFRALADPKIWSSAVTNGIFVRFGSVELSHDELLSMAEREHEKQGEQ